MTLNLHGVLTALATPFTPDHQIDSAALRQTVDRSIDGGVHGVVAGGSTGEFASLSPDERRRVVDEITQHTAGRVPVVAQTGATTTDEAIRHSKAAQASGADVLMLVTPFYEPLSLAETVQYIKDVSSAVDLPVMLYNIPGATGVNLDPETVRQLSDEVDTIRYIKDSSADWEQALQLIHHHSESIKTFIGWDVYIYSALAEGAAGVMAGAANVIPQQIVAVHRLIEEGRLGEALTAWNRIYPAIDAMISEPFIAAVKAGMRIQGASAGVPRPPMADVSPDALEGIRASLNAVHA